MKRARSLYLRLAYSGSAFYTGVALNMHPHHGIEHFGCIVLGILLWSVGLLGLKRSIDCRHIPEEKDK